MTFLVKNHGKNYTRVDNWCCIKYIFFHEFMLKLNVHSFMCRKSWSTSSPSLIFGFAWATLSPIQFLCTGGRWIRILGSVSLFSWLLVLLYFSMCCPWLQALRPVAILEWFTHSHSPSGVSAPPDAHDSWITVPQGFPCCGMKCLLPRMRFYLCSQWCLLPLRSSICLLCLCFVCPPSNIFLNMFEKQHQVLLRLAAHLADDGFLGPFQSNSLFLPHRSPSSTLPPRPYQVWSQDSHMNVLFLNTVHLQILKLKEIMRIVFLTSVAHFVMSFLRN